jgi:hypothetical protein
MKKQSTNMDMQRADFVESLHNSLRKQAKQAINDHSRFVALADEYVKDGLEDSECIELLMIDGISKEAAEGYVTMAKNENVVEDSQGSEYSFQFEDSYGKIWSSFDLSKTVHASSDEEAWSKAAEIIDGQSNIESERIISVNRI